MTTLTKNTPGFRIHPVAQLNLNWRQFHYVVISNHYEKRHRSSINDTLILDLVRELEGHLQTPELYEAPYAYFTSRIILRGRQYRLIWLLEDSALYLGVINAFRDQRKLKRN